MSRFYLFSFSAIVLIANLAGPAQAANLVTNGSFETPNVGTNWALFSNGTVAGWSSNNNEIEIDYSANTVGGAAYDGNQSAELDGTTFDTLSQIISGLTIGQQYTLSWAYGLRPGSGQQQMNVSFGGALVKSDFDYASNNSSLIWTYESINVMATATQELLSFAALDTSAIGGNTSVGNELDAVSLTSNSPTTTRTGTSSVPEPMSLSLVGSGLLMMGWLRRVERQKIASASQPVPRKSLL